MKIAFAAAALVFVASPAIAQQYAANEAYRICPAAQTDEGIRVVKDVCGVLKAPAFDKAGFSSLSELESARSTREHFTASVDEYGQCVSRFINSYRRPGADANSKAPDQAACAHSWAEDQATKAVRDYGHACIAFSNRSMTDGDIEPWSGDCYPSVGKGQG